MTPDDVQRLAEHLAKEHIVPCMTIPLGVRWTIVVSNGDVTAVASNHPDRTDMLLDLSKIVRAGLH